MMDHYQTAALEEIMYFYIVPLISSIMYFKLSKNAELTTRILVSSHGYLLVASSLFTVIISSITTGENFKIEYYFFLFLLTLSVASIFYAIKQYKGNPIIHLFQIINLLSVFVFWFIGGMTLSHDWL